jgi:uncharacterized membrane protein
MPKSTLAGHPLHPMLVVAPAALLPFAAVLDAMHRVTDNDDYAKAAYYSLTGALIGGLAAGVAGAMDYLTIQPDTDVKRTANMHAMLNTGALAVTAANVAMRRNEHNHTGGSLLLSTLAAAGVIVSGWFGGRLVYEQGMRVKGVSPVAHERDLELMPSEERFEHAMIEAEKYVPSRGPQMH